MTYDLSFSNSACCLGEIVVQSLSASAAASAFRIEVASSWATNALLSVPDIDRSGADLAGTSCGVLVGQVIRAVAGIGLGVPDSGSIARSTSLSVGVVVRTSSALTLGSIRIESESGRTALAFSSTGLIVGVGCASLALFSSGVPEVRSNTCNTLLSSSQVGSGVRADTVPGISDVKGESEGAGQAFSGLVAPNSRSVASNTLVGGIKMRNVGGALALKGGGVEDQVSSAADTLFSVGVPEGREVATNAFSAGVKVGMSRRADTLLLVLIIDVVGWASLTSVGSSVPPAGRGASAEASGVNEWEVGRADAGLGVSIIHLVGGA